jgi:peptidoglycan/xylan/chitin deacetylase (PgdA/CDA1 family)
MIFRTRLTFLIALSLTLLCASLAFSQKRDKGSKEICITFDELPAARTFGEVDVEAINYLLLDALKRHDVKAAGFVVGERVEGSWDILGEWLNAGHTLGNLTWSGQDYNLLEPDQFIADIRKGADALKPMLSGFGQKERYFRFPYLHYGETVEKRRAVGIFLDDKDYVVCPATVIPEDYLYNLQLTKLGKSPDSAKFMGLMNDYVNHVLDELSRVELVANKIIRRPVKQILQLRSNRLNAVFLNDLLTALEADGYRFITIDQALKDEVYSAPEAYYGLKGLGYLDMIEQSDPDLLPAQ